MKGKLQIALKEIASNFLTILHYVYRAGRWTCEEQYSFALGPAFWYFLLLQNGDDTFSLLFYLYPVNQQDLLAYCTNSTFKNAGITCPHLIVDSFWLHGNVLKNIQFSFKFMELKGKVRFLIFIHAHLSCRCCYRLFTNLSCKTPNCRLNVLLNLYHPLSCILVAFLASGSKTKVFRLKNHASSKQLITQLIRNARILVQLIHKINNIPDKCQKKNDVNLNAWGIILE